MSLTSLAEIVGLIIIVTVLLPFIFAIGCVLYIFAVIFGSIFQS